MLRVLKAVNLLNDRNEPTETYAKYMSLDSGGRALGPEVRRVYEPFFQSSHVPYNESNEKLKNLFNIHSGGGNTTIENQIQTFKALCENALFDSEIISGTVAAASINSSATPSVTGGIATPVMHINLHIHLPENKSRRDYEDIIESIGRYIFGRSDGQST